MPTTLNIELEHNKKRLAYYTDLKEKRVSPKLTDKWIEIYSERVAKLERQLKKLQLQAAQQLETPSLPGLKVQHQKSATATRARRA